MGNKLMSYLLMAALTMSLGLLGKMGCDRSELMSANDQLNRELMQADLEKGRALTKFGDAEDYIDELEDQIKEEIKEREATVTRYGELQAKYNTLKRDLVADVKVVYKDRIIEIPQDVEDLSFVRGTYYKATSEKTLVPIVSLEGVHEDHRVNIRGLVQPNPEGQGDVDWKFDYELKLRFELQFAETHMSSGAINHYATMWELDDKGERIEKLEIEKFAVVVEKPEDKQWFWWAPHVDVGGLVGAKLTPPDLALGGSVGFSPFAYGRTVNDLDWRFLRISLDLAGNIPGIGISPVVGNLGQPLPLLSNLWVGPHVSWQPPEGWSVFLFVGAML